MNQTTPDPTVTPMSPYPADIEWPPTTNLGVDPEFARITDEPDDAADEWPGMDNEDWHTTRERGDR